MCQRGTPRGERRPRPPNADQRTLTWLRAGTRSARRRPPRISVAPARATLREPDPGELWILDVDEMLTAHDLPALDVADQPKERQMPLDPGRARRSAPGIPSSAARNARSART